MKTLRASDSSLNLPRCLGNLGTLENLLTERLIAASLSEDTTDTQRKIATLLSKSRKLKEEMRKVHKGEVTMTPMMRKGFVLRYDDLMNYYDSHSLNMKSA